ncbi:MAG: adenylyl-sulfate kinase [Methylobacter sp.]|nr:MAG: adenylyl-sulfate kinase [Methylobacter sp.]PPD19284.1 MAG: adenylyl-sulfate kinase [Methylobacter sp.]PPD31881.1 MAG: adenylyl-sulfate kinase [Methylomonas sp.]
MAKTLTAKPSIFWVTGLSGAGKSSFARALVDSLRSRGEAVVLLDGDELREVFGAASASEADFSRHKRLSLAMQYAHLCRVISGQGLIVVIATISLFRELHAWNRAHLPGYFEIYLKVPLEELRRRDPKGIYRRFDAGLLKNVAGLDIAVDEPEAADWMIEFEQNQSPQHLVDELLKHLHAKAQWQSSKA